MRRAAKEEAIKVLQDVEELDYKTLFMKKGPEEKAQVTMPDEDQGDHNEDEFLQSNEKRDIEMLKNL